MLQLHRAKADSESNAEKRREGAAFKPARLTLARERRAMSKADLAAATGLSPNSISSYESSKRTPTDENVEKLAQATRFPISFFFGPDPDLVEAEAVSFRALARMAAKKRDIVTSSAAIAAEVVDAWITEHYERPEVRVPDLSDLSPDLAAEVLRAEWGLGVEPIGSVIQMMEERGVRVYSLAASDTEYDLDDVFGLSMWFDGTPFVFVNMAMTAERVRFSLLHELGHLVLHRNESTDTRVAEKEANTFAGHLQIPTSVLKAEARSWDSFEDILERKERWGAAAIAYVYRMHEADIIGEWRYRELCVRLRRDYGKSEPRPIAHSESSELLRQVFDDLREEGGRRYLADDVDVPVDVLDDLVFMHILTAQDGGGGRPDLRIV